MLDDKHTNKHISKLPSNLYPLARIKRPTMESEIFKKNFRDIKTYHLFKSYNGEIKKPTVKDQIIFITNKNHKHNYIDETDNIIRNGINGENDNIITNKINCEDQISKMKSGAVYNKL